MLQFLAGLTIGTLGGMLLMACLVVGKDADKSTGENDRLNSVIRTMAQRIADERQRNGELVALIVDLESQIARIERMLNDQQADS